MIIFRIFRVFFSFIILIIGLIFSFVSLGMYSLTKVEEPEKTIAIIDQITYAEDVFVTYEVGGRNYTEELNAYSSSFRVGDEVEIYYNTLNPSEISYAEIDGFFNIFIVIGLFMAISSGFFIIVDIIKISRNNKIHKYGEMVEATIVGVEKKGTFSRVIVCQWYSPNGESYTFKSGKLFWDVNKTLQRNNINTINVKVYMKNPNLYYIDTMFLSKLETEHIENNVMSSDFKDEIERLNNNVNSSTNLNNNDDGAIKYK